APAPAPADDTKKQKEPKKGLPVPAAAQTADPVVQSSPGTSAAPALGLGFEGIGQGLRGPSTGLYAPPDPNGAVGSSNYVELVNTELDNFTNVWQYVYIT